MLILLFSSFVTGVTVKCRRKLGKREFTFRLANHAFAALAIVLVCTTQSARCLAEIFQGDHLCSEVQQALRVLEAGNGVVDALRLVFADASDTSAANVAAEQFKSFDQFAGLLLAGCTPRLLETMTLDATTVANRTAGLQPPAWQLGNWAQHGRLARRIWEEAKTRMDKDPEKASRLAIAAMVLAAQDRFNPSPLAQFLKDPAAANMTGVEVKQLQALFKEVDLTKKLSEETFARRAAVAEPLNRCIEFAKPGQEYGTNAASVVDGFRQGWPRVTSRDEAWLLSNLVWRFYCLSRANADQKSIDAVTGLVKELGPRTDDLYARRWLEQVLTIPGERPKNSGVRIIRDPNEMKPGKGP
jgi:hypothetical protein